MCHCHDPEWHVSIPSNLDMVWSCVLYYMKLREEIHPCYNGLITYSVSCTLYWLGGGFFGKLVNLSGVNMNDFGWVVGAYDDFIQFFFVYAKYSVALISMTGVKQYFSVAPFFVLHKEILNLESVHGILKYDHSSPAFK